MRDHTCQQFSNEMLLFFFTKFNNKFSLLKFNNCVKQLKIFTPPFFPGYDS